MLYLIMHTPCNNNTAVKNKWFWIDQLIWEWPVININVYGVLSFLHRCLYAPLIQGAHFIIMMTQFWTQPIIILIHSWIWGICKACHWVGTAVLRELFVCRTQATCISCTSIKCSWTVWLRTVIYKSVCLLKF